MLILRDPASVSLIADPELRRLVEQRFIDICGGEDDAPDDYDPDIHGYFIVVEPGDSIDLLQQESGCSLLHSYEVLEEHASCYEMVFVPGDGDFGIVLLIPKQPGIDPELLAMCAEYATPAP